jgi:CheY-like chemotaxis protein
VRAVTIRLLQGKGYRVSEATDGATALEALEMRGPPDLLLSDVVLPRGIDGYALASLARERYPGLRVLLMSGYPRDALASTDSSDIKLLQKPFTRVQLHRAVEDALSA